MPTIVTMNQVQLLISNATVIESKLGYQFKDRSLLALAFVHRSFVNENRDITEHNERLEFLGDSVLGMIMADYLYRNLPATPEGQLSYLRSRLVEAASCVSYIHVLGIAPYILLGKGERMNDGRGRETILADLFEAIIGAIYLDGGFAAIQQFFFSHFSTHIKSILETPESNWKALLQDHCQKHYQQTPVYTVLQESGPDHHKSFEIAVSIQQRVLGRGMGSSKKEAQQAAAADALTRCKVSISS